jgi:hypothetical protein
MELGIVQWYSICLAYERPCVHHKEKKETKTPKLNLKKLQKLHIYTYKNRWDFSFALCTSV